MKRVRNIIFLLFLMLQQMLLSAQAVTILDAAESAHYVDGQVTILLRHSQ